MQADTGHCDFPALLEVCIHTKKAASIKLQKWYNYWRNKRHLLCRYRNLQSAVKQKQETKFKKIVDDFSEIVYFSTKCNDIDAIFDNIRGN